MWKQERDDSVSSFPGTYRYRREEGGLLRPHILQSIPREQRTKEFHLKVNINNPPQLSKIPWMGQILRCWVGFHQKSTALFSWLFLFISTKFFFFHIWSFSEAGGRCHLSNPVRQGPMALSGGGRLDCFSTINPNSPNLRAHLKTHNWRLNPNNRIF